jgi:hypothetical protein
LTAGGFADLVAKKYYDNMPIQKVLELFVQTGKPDKVYVATFCVIHTFDNCRLLRNKVLKW